MSMRRFAALINALPLDSATARTIDPRQGWGNLEELTATNAELLGRIIELTGKAHFKDFKVPELRIPRPYDQPREDRTAPAPHRPAPAPERRAATKEELKRFMGKNVRYTPRKV
jgi:hypothetical protein